MSEVQETQPLVGSATLTEMDKNVKTNALIAYGLMIVGMFTGIFWFVGAIWAMIKKSEAQGTVFADHYNNIIRTFWISFGLMIVGALLAIVLVGYFVMLFAYFWAIYRIIKGVAKLTSDKAYYSA